MPKYEADAEERVLRNLKFRARRSEVEWREPPFLCTLRRFGGVFCPFLPGVLSVCLQSLKWLPTIGFQGLDSAGTPAEATPLAHLY
jgi:hypothetical protein